GCRAFAWGADALGSANRPAQSVARSALVLRSAQAQTVPSAIRPTSAATLGHQCAALWIHRLSSSDPGATLTPEIEAAAPVNVSTIPRIVSRSTEEATAAMPQLVHEILPKIVETGFAAKDGIDATT